MISPRTSALREKSRDFLCALKDNIQVSENGRRKMGSNTLDEIRRGVDFKRLCDYSDQACGDNEKGLPDDFLKENFVTSGDYHPCYRDGHLKSPCQRDPWNSKENISNCQQCLTIAFRNTSCRKLSKCFPISALANSSPQCSDSTLNAKPMSSENVGKSLSSKKSEPNLKQFVQKVSQMRRASETNTTFHEIKPLSMDQCRAADDQMHAPTHSHSTSKCYCTHNNNRLKRAIKISAKVYGRRQHIPPKLKEQRYKAQPHSRYMRMVRWADKCQNHDVLDEQKLSSEKHLSISEVSCSPGKFTNLHHSLLPLNSSTGKQSLISQVKTFRHSHWLDCHAHSNAPTAKHDCVRHYVLNKRLFLEPVSSGNARQITCPVCSLYFFCPSTEMKEIEGDRFSPELTVTLPKVLLKSNTKKTSSTSQQTSEWPSFKKFTKECVRHPLPTNSLALSHHVKYNRSNNLS